MTGKQRGRKVGRGKKILEEDIKNEQCLNKREAEILRTDGHNEL